MITLRPATLADVVMISLLHQQLFASAGWSEATLHSSLSLPTTQGWLAVDDGQSVGFILLQQSGDSAEILTLGVASSQQRRGIAKILLQQALAVLPLGGRMFLEVAADNAAAIALYEKIGFQLSRRRQAYYRCNNQPIDALEYFYQG